MRLPPKNAGNRIALGSSANVNLYTVMKESVSLRLVSGADVDGLGGGGAA